ncbi:MAG: Carbonic anhydrase [Acidobacteriaceae bacterium]|nr:Carbonic anhydrase [Acidobacteriaceae bacterium]
MNFIETISQRNEEFVRNGHLANLKIIPSTKTIIIGCLDPRVDPMNILGLKPGEAAIIRNIGGRVNPALLETLILLPIVAKAAGQEMGPGWNLVILHHTDCGIIGCYQHAPDLLATHLGVTRSELESMAITDPRKAVAMDVAAYKAVKELPGGFIISGIVYDISTGKIEVIVPPSLLRLDQ